jgi:hypothetical protein
MSDHAGDEPTTIVDRTSDEVLRVLARLAQEDGVEMGITVAVGGGLVSGVLIAREKWLDKYVLAYSTSDKDGQEFARQLRAAFGEDDLPESDDSPFRYHYLHLQDAQVVHGSTGLPVDRAGFWRVRLDAVTGWSPGALRAPASGTPTSAET